MLKVAIATTSCEKIRGIKNGLSRFLQIAESELEVYSRRTESGVSEQPFGEETYAGALNRVNSVKNAFKDFGIDYYISCEAGIETAFNQYFNVQVVCLYDSKNKKYLWGKSVGWALPSKDIEIIKEKTLDNYLKLKGLTCIEDLLGINYSRNSAIAEAIEIALAVGKLV